MANPLGVSIQVTASTTSAQFQQQINSLTKNTTANVRVNLNQTETRKELTNILSDLDRVQKTFTSLNARFAGSSGFTKYAEDFKQIGNSLNELNGIPKTVENFSKFQDVLTKTGPATYSLENNLQNLTKATRNFNSQIADSFGKNNLFNQMQDYLNKFSTISEGSYGNEIRKLMDSLDSPNVDRKQVANEFSVLRGEIKSLGLESKTTGQQLREMFGKHLDIALIMVGIHALQSAMQTLTTNVIELDKAMTNLQIASGKTGSEVSQMARNYVTIGKEIGASATGLLNSAAEWSRQGFATNEIETLLRNASALEKVGFVNLEDATKNLTAAMKGFNISVEDSIRIVDALTKIDAMAAISAGDLSNGLNRTAASAQLAGVEMEKTMGYLASIGEVTQQNMESIGTSLRTIFARMGNIKVGRLIDPDTAEPLNDVETTLSNLGIRLRDSNEEFRNFGDVLDEVASKWDSFNSVEKNSVAVSISGQRQRENFLVLMQNYEKALAYEQAALESSGSALEKYGIYQDSIQGKSESLNAALQGLTMTLVNSDLVKGFLDLSTALVSFGDSATQAIGVLPILSSLLSSIMTMSGRTGGLFAPFGVGKDGLGIGLNSFKTLNEQIKTFNTISEKSTDQQIRFNRTISATNPQLLNYFRTVKSGQASFGGYIGSLVTATAQTIALQVATVALNAAIGLGIGIVINGAITLIDQLVNAEQHAKEAFDKIVSDLENVSSELETTNARIVELEGKDSLTIIEETELEKLRNTNKELELQIANLERIKEIEGNNLGQEIKKSFDWEYGQNQQFNENDINSYINQYTNNNIPIGHLLQEQNNIEALIAAYRIFQEEKQNAIGAGDNDALERYNKELESVELMLRNNITKFEEWKEELPEGSELLGTLNEGLELIRNELGDLNSLEVTENPINDLAENMDSGVTEIIDQSELLKSVINDTFSEISRLQSGYDLLIQASEEYAVYGNLTAETMSQLASSGMLEYLTMVGDELTFNADALIADEEAARRNAEMTLKAGLAKDLYKLATEGATDAELAAANGAQSAATGATIMGNEFAKSVNGIVNAEAALRSFFATSMGKQLGNNAFSGKMGQVRDLVNTYNGAYSALQSIESISSRDPFQGATRGAGRATNAAKDNADATKAAANAQREYNEQLKIQKELLENQEDAINDLLEMTIKMIKQEQKLAKEAINEEIDAAERLMDIRVKALELELKGYEERIDSQKKLLQLQEQERDYQNELADRTLEISNIESKIASLLRDESESTQKQRIKLEEQLAELKENLAEYQHDRGIELAEDALDTEYNRFEKVQNDKIAAYEEEFAKFEEIKQRELETIDRYLSMEGQIRLDAIALIEGRTQEFYDRLIMYNRFWGDGVNQTVVDAWNNAYNALMLYNGGAILVTETLRQIASIMADIDNKTRSATNAVNDYNNAVNSGGGGSGGKGGNSSSNTAWTDWQHSAPAGRYRVISRSGTEIANGLSELEAKQLANSTIGRNLGYTIKAYAKGLRKAGATHMGIVDEPWKGDEMYFRTSNGSRLKQIEVGSTILDANKTNTMMSFANNPFEFIKNLFKNNTPNITNNSNNQPIQIDASLNVAGSIDGNSIETVKSMMASQRKLIYKELSQSLKLSRAY